MSYNQSFLLRLSTQTNINKNHLENDIKGINQLSKDGVVGIIDLVESMHQSIYSLGGLMNRGDSSKTSGLTGLIYNSIRKTTELSTLGINLAVQTFAPLLPYTANPKTRINWLSILNGVIGDHLDETGNPLSLSMTWHHQDQSISPQQAAAICSNKPGKVLFLIHGLCMNEQLWTHHGHDHGKSLAANNELTTIYIRYNSGLAVYKNGQRLAQMMHEFVSAIPDKQQFNVLCHSMGGLVMRSALHVATLSGSKWLNSIEKLIFLGTPHQGAILEKTGNLIDYLISINPYSAPFAKLTQTRSHGINNLRLGTVTKDHQNIQLPSHIKCYAFAASNAPDHGKRLHKKWIGDGLVSVDSALGHHKNQSLEIYFPIKHQLIFHNTNHMTLLSNHDVFKSIERVINH